MSDTTLDLAKKLFKLQWLLFCEDFHDAGLTNGKCCTACHRDHEDGNDDLIEMVPPTRPGQKSNTRALVCCSVSGQVQQTRENFAKALRANRARWREV